MGTAARTAARRSVPDLPTRTLLVEGGAVLSSENRLRRRTEFSDVVRRGRRASRPLLTVHLLAAADEAPPRAGLVVSRAVGGSVVRTRVARRLRHQLRAVINGLPRGSRLVVRATPRAADAAGAELGRDLRGALERLVP